MSEIVTPNVEETLPGAATVLEGQGIPRWKDPGSRIEKLAEEALSIYRANARPIGIMTMISKEDFSTVFGGEELNHESSPVGPIFRSSDTIDLFAVTVGPALCEAISELFRGGDYALASMLDSAASAGAETTAQFLEDSVRSRLRKNGTLKNRIGVMRFSPGYCGWDVSGQKKLFAHLSPERIGITLNTSFLMSPIKSISGIIVTAQRDVFFFEDTFSFCRDCATHTCRERQHLLMNQE